MSKEMLGGCCVCSDDRGWPENPLVYCDGTGCNVAVHQACYGIVTVPSGPWFCRKCELKERPRCELCPSKEGAFKKTDNHLWAHVVCALYIPEVRFGNVTTMEPILISLIPQDRFNRTCYICEESNRGSSKANFGACMNCNKTGCRSTFHVTCAQMLGLLCEEAGNMMDNVKYCGYCQHHYAKLKATRHMKIIPPYRPVPSNNSRSVSPALSSEKSSAHGQGGKSTGGGTSTSTEDGKSGSTSTPTHSGSGSGSTPQSSSAEGGKPNNNISPDINSSCSSKTNNKNAGKKGSSYHGAGGNKATNNSMLDNKNGSASSATHDKTDGKGKGHGHVKNSASDSDHSSVRCEDNLTVKLERLDEKTAAKTGFGPKKDFSTIQLKEVVTAALDRPITNSPGSKFDHTSSSLTSGLDGPSSSITPTSSIVSSHSGSRHSHGHVSKLAPPDIKPDVTLTPIPMKPNISSRHGSGKDEERDVGDRDGFAKTPGASSLAFHHSFGAPPKLQNQQVSPDISEAASSKGNKPPELTQEDIPVLDKASSGPPTKRARGMSRDDERERELQRRTPTKGRGGRRGSTTGSYSRRGDASSAVAFVDDSSFDEIIEANGSNNGSTESSSRGGRQSAGRKNGTITITTRSSNSNSNANNNTTTTPIPTVSASKPPEDPPAPTLSQLAKSGQLGGETPPAGLAPHMFGNALNPSSTMALKMVDTLSEEMEAVVAAGGVPEVAPVQTPLVGIPIPGINKPSITAPAIASSSSTSSSSSTNGIQAPPQTLEQLLERQWEQGSQFLMEQAQHLDIAQLLSCLNQLKQDNKALEEHVQSLIQRRDQLTAINARLSIPLGSSSALGTLGSAFGGGGGSSGNSGANNNSHHNGYATITQSTPSPNVHPPHAHGPPGQGQGSKSHPVANPTPSPQQQHEHVSQHGRDRERNTYNLSDISAGRAELVVTHSSQGMHPVHPNHGASHANNHRSQMMNSSYNSYGSHSIPAGTSLSSPHSHQQNHPPSRDGR